MGIAADSWTVWMPQTSSVLSDAGDKERRGVDAQRDSEDGSKPESPSGGGVDQAGCHSRRPADLPTNRGAAHDR